MSSSHDIVEWHLTPRGWLQGLTVYDHVQQGEDSVPGDRVLTLVYVEDISSAFSRPTVTWRVKSACAPVADIWEYLSRFGVCPGINEAISTALTAFHERRRDCKTGPKRNGLCECKACEKTFKALNLLNFHGLSSI